jgi:processive 1,2-diacylglycerol beta-glucosyltransferase
MPNRILILSASVGAGHLRAAEAVELALRQVAPDAVVRNIDILTLTNAAFRRVYGRSYLDLVNHAPEVLGYLYEWMDRPRRANSWRDATRRLVERLNLRALCEMLECEQWDVVVNTHFLPAEIIALLRRKRKIVTPQITVTTDFETHRLWVNLPCERFTTATPEGAAYLQYWGVEPASIRVTGIPIHPVFADNKTPRQCARAQGLAGDRPVILQLAGGFGVGPIEKLYGGLLNIATPIDLLVVTGRNARVRKQLESILVPQRHRVRILGFTTEMDELMGAADLVVSKPGGLTTSEALARGTPLAIVNPIPGQESRNADYLLERGAAIKINTLATISMKIDALLNDRQRLDQLKHNARALAKPRAAYEVAEMAMGMAMDTAGSV